MTITRKNGSHGLSAMSAYAPQVLSAPLSCRCPQALACKSTGQMLRSRTSIAKNTRCSCKVLPPASVPQSREPPCTSFLNGSSPSSAKTSKPCGGALQGREGRGRQEAEPADLASAFEKNSRHSSAEGRFRASLESIRDSIRRRPWHRQGPLKVNPFPIPSAPLAPGPWPLACPVTSCGKRTFRCKVLATIRSWLSDQKGIVLQSKA